MDVLVAALEILMRWDVIACVAGGLCRGCCHWGNPGCWPRRGNCNFIACNIFHGPNCGFNHAAWNIWILNVWRRNTGNFDQYTGNRSQRINNL